MVPDAGGLIGAGVAFGKWFAGFAMGEIEPAFSRHEKLAADRGFGIEQCDPHAGRGSDLGSAQTGWAATDDGELDCVFERVGDALL